ncbi:DUF2213 domain-containing protein [Xenorhabdus szentirmaii]|uniref:DUF2213 domain-containing protein n=1 Tax=Xenorhabdus szentirmaii TaxID=290112 RepID=UPI002B406A60|nr:DUF2213 domain-containing protein [Xenorhabdus sp. 38]
MSKRTYDLNGWLEVKDNPISKVGVFDYMGAEIGAPNPDQLYRVLRPQEELESEATLHSFRLMPFVDEHEMLGRDGTPAEKKGIEGVIGENVYFDYPYLKGNIKILSNAALNQIASGKIELSPGYRCHYEFTPGTFEGEHYDAIQRDIRANHLALVDEGRTGPDVAVQDHVITIDTRELVTMATEEQDKKETTDNGFTPEQLEQLQAMIAAAVAGQAPWQYPRVFSTDWLAAWSGKPPIPALSVRPVLYCPQRTKPRTCSGWPTPTKILMSSRYR